MTSQQYQYMMNLRRMTLLAARANLAAGYAEPEETQQEPQQETPAFQIFLNNLLVTSSNPLVISYSENTSKFSNAQNLVIKPTDTTLNMSDVANIWIECDDPDFNEQVSLITYNPALNPEIATCADDGSKIDIATNAFAMNIFNGSQMFNKGSGTFKVELLTAPAGGDLSLIAECDVPFKLADDIPVWGSGKYTLFVPGYSQNESYELTWSQEYLRYQDPLTYMLLTKSGNNVFLNLIHKYGVDDDYYTTLVYTPYRPLLLGSISGQTSMPDTTWTLQYSAD